MSAIGELGFYIPTHLMVGIFSHLLSMLWVEKQTLKWKLSRRRILQSVLRINAGEEKVRKQDWVEEKTSSSKAVSAEASAKPIGNSRGHFTATLS